MSSQTTKEQIRLSIRSSLHEVRNFFINEYSLGSMEAHHDGHPIEKPARAAWDKLHEALDDLDKLKEWDAMTQTTPAPQLTDEAWEFIRARSEQSNSASPEHVAFEGDFGNWNWLWSEIWKRCQ